MDEQQPRPAPAPRVLPHDADAEAAIISSILFDNNAVSTAFELVKPDDFYRADLRLIYAGILELFSKNIRIDLITLKNTLEVTGVFDQAGGMDALVNLSGIVSTGVNIRHYSKIVADRSVMRRLISAGSEIVNQCYDTTVSVDAAAEFAEKRVFDVLSNRNTTGFAVFNEVIYESLRRVEEAFNSKERVTGVRTGFTDFDEKTTGLQPSDLILLAARPSMGKTALGLNIACHAAFHDKVPTAIFSLEMNKEQIVSRMLSSESMVDSQRMRTGELSDDDWGKMFDTVALVADAPIYIDDTPGITVNELRAKCRRLKLEKGLGLIIIDYLQLMSGSGRPESRQQEVSEISRSLKAVAREMQAPVLLMSQLSRACEQRSDHRPILSDLRESGAIEQDADIVAFIYRDEYYHPESDKHGIAEVIIAKQRNGPTGTVELRYLNQYTRFANLERE